MLIDPRTTDAANSQLDALQERADALNNRLEQTFARTFDTIGRSLEGFVSKGNFSVSSLQRSLDRLLQSVLSNTVTDVTRRLTQGALQGDVFGGFRAHGGSVQPNHAYVVGEQGAEVFVPTTSGTILPNGSGSMGSPVVNVSITTQDANSFLQSRSQVQAAIASAVRSGMRQL